MGINHEPSGKIKCEDDSMLLAATNPFAEASIDVVLNQRRSAVDAYLVCIIQSLVKNWEFQYFNPSLSPITCSC
jgi:hypothetical protein